VTSERRADADEGGNGEGRKSCAGGDSGLERVEEQDTTRLRGWWRDAS